MKTMLLAATVLAASSLAVSAQHPLRVGMPRPARPPPPLLLSTHLHHQPRQQATHIMLGQPFNVPPPAKMALYNKEGIGGIIRMDRDGKNREVFARGIRNSVGQD